MYDTSELDTTELITSQKEAGMQRAKIDWRIFVQSIIDYYNKDEIFLDNIKFNETKEYKKKIIVCKKKSTYIPS